MRFPLETITTAADIKTWIANNNPGGVLAEPPLQVPLVEALRSANHPAWGTDWGAWLNERAPKLVEKLARKGTKRSKPDRAAARQAAQEKHARERESARRERIDKLEGECRGWETTNAGHEADIRRREAEIKSHRDAIDLELTQVKRARKDVKANEGRCRAARKRLAALRKG